jgi:riboflavin kinase/FMN adenylyltransferase
VNVAHYPDDSIVKWHQPVLALGNFDGLHRGHMKIIDRVRRRAGERAGTPAAMTFDPHPPRVVRPDKAPPLLMTKEQKIEALGRSGMQGIAVVRFTLDVSHWEPEVFVRTVLVEWLHVVEVWVGANFLFGHQRAGNYSVLRSLGARYGFRAEKIDPVRYKDFVVSSTRIRRLISEGRVDEAGSLLGHHYFIDGTVVRGAGRGREIGVPTANLQTANELVPPSGTSMHRSSRSTSWTTTRISIIASCGCRSCSGCETSARFPTSTPCAVRSRRTAAARGGSSAGFHCRIV